MPSWSDLKEIYSLRNHIFTIRFFPLFAAVLILLYITPNYLNTDFHYLYYSLISLLLAFLFSIVWIRFSQKIQYAKDLNSKGEFLREYNFLNNLENEPLWNSEKFTLDLNRAKLFYDVGNNHRFLLIMKELSPNIEKYPKENSFFRLLNSFNFELKNDYKSAKRELEYIIENTDKNDIKLQANNNLGRIEMIQKNLSSGEILYKKSFELLKLNPEPYFFPIVIHNLLISYAKNNEQEKATNLFEEYWELIDKNKAQQVLNYANDMLHYARQIGSDSLVEKSYKIMDERVYSLSKKSEQFILDIAKLRMSYNDNIDFNEHYKKVFEKIKVENDKFSLEEKILVVREIKHVLTQHIQNKNDIENIYYDLKWLTDWHLSLETDITNKLTTIESALPILKVLWLGRLSDLKKSKIMFLDKSENYLPYVKSIVSYIDESISIWKDSDNAIKLIYELFHIMDELNGYFMQTKDFRLIELYKDKVIKYLQEATRLLELNWHKPGIEEYMISLAWFSWHIGNNRELASRWLDRFDGLNHSLNHYAEFIRVWYSETRKWISYTNQIAINKRK